MLYFYDTEFIEDGKTIDLVSIGIVSGDGREYYAQSCEYNPSKASDWVKDNVLVHLDVCSHTLPNSQSIAVDSRIKAFRKHIQGQCYDQCPWKTRSQIKDEILAFMDVEKYGKPELWAYYADYDHVAFCQLFGTMMDLPSRFPMYTLDIKQWTDMLGNPELPNQEGIEHNALSDARWNKLAWEFLKGYEREQKP